MKHQFSGALTTDQMKQHLSHTFEMPPQAVQVNIRLKATEGAIDGLSNMLTLTIFDANGFRGAGHRGGQLHEVTISQTQATAGYIAGPLSVGTWNIQIDTHRILAESVCEYQLDIEIVLGDQAVPSTISPSDTPDFSFVANPNPGWYRGDFHSHTIHSDASWDVPDLVAAAREYNLDFIRY